MVYFWFAAIALFILHYYLCVVKSPILVCKEGKYKDFLMKHCSTIREKYWPTWWCFEGRFQSYLVCVLREFQSKLKYQREFLQLRDGGRISLDWFENKNNQCKTFETSSTKPIVLFIPGITGDSQSYYFRSLVLQAHALGFRCVVANYRGRGGVPLLTPRIFCACNCEDLTEVIDHIKSKYPKAPLIGTGISLGGVILTHYLVQSGSHCRLSAAMAISIVWNGFEATKSIQRPILNLMLICGVGTVLGSEIKKNKHLFKNSPVKMDKISQVYTLKHYDTEVISKIYGYKDVDDYYNHACLDDKLHEIKVPFLSLNSVDDPFQPISSYLIKEVKQSSHVALVMTPRGGHVAFLEGLFPFKSTFMDRLFSEFISAFSQHSTELTEISEQLMQG